MTYIKDGSRHHSIFCTVFCGVFCAVSQCCTLCYILCYILQSVLQDLLLLKATSTATLSSLGQCLRMLQHQQVSPQLSPLLHFLSPSRHIILSASISVSLPNSTSDAISLQITFGCFFKCHILNPMMFSTFLSLCL